MEQNDKIAFCAKSSTTEQTEQAYFWSFRAKSTGAEQTESPYVVGVPSSPDFYGDPDLTVAKITHQGRKSDV